MKKEGVTISFDGATIYNNGGTINGDIVNPSYYSSSIPSDGLPRMPHHLNFRQATMLCQMMKKGGFISEANNNENFCAVMGCIDVTVEKMQPIVWTSNVQLLREMLESVYHPLLENKALTKADIERRVPMCFVKEDKTPLTLANPKTLPNDAKSNKMREILATFIEKTIDY